MHHGSAEDLPNLHVLDREVVGHCFNGVCLCFVYFKVYEFLMYI
jgi:hypothetical protein